MKNLISISILISIAFFANAQQNYFPIVKGGKWGAINVEGKILIQPKYDYLSPFKNGVAIFDKNQILGLVDTNSRVLTTKNYDGITDLYKKEKGRFLYLVKNKQEQGIIDERGIEIVPLKYVKIKLHNTTYIGNKLGKSVDVGKLDKGFGYNAKVDSIRIINKTFHLHYNDSITSVTTNNGRPLFADSSLFIEQKRNGVLLHLKNQKLVFIDNKYKTIIDTNLTYTGKNNSIYYFKNKEGENIYYSFVLKQFFKNDGILSVIKYGKFYILNNNDLFGVLDSNKNKIVDYKYNSIRKNGKYFFAFIDGKTAVYSNKFKLIIPPIYEQIIPTSLGYIYSKDSLQGLLNKKGTKITEPRFQSINTNSIPVKCYLPKKGVVHILFDEKNRFVSKKEFKNYLSLSSRFNSISSSRINSSNFDVKRGEYGWFLDSIEITKQDCTKIKVGKWGIRDKEDSIVVTPKYMRYQVINDSLSYAYRGLNNKDYKRINGIPVGGSFWVINHHTGELINRSPFHGISLWDFNSGNIARSMTSKGITLIDSNYTILDKNFHYAHPPQDGMILFSKLLDKKSKGKITKKIATSTVWLAYKYTNYKKDTWNDYNSFKYSNYYRNKPMKQGYYNTKTGAMDYGAKFDFATSFYNGVAFVGNQTETVDSYGIIRKDSVIVPLKYSAVNYFYPWLYDSLYIVTDNNTNTFLIDSSLNKKTINFSNIRRVNNNVIIASQNNKYGILDDNLNWVLEPTYRRILKSRNNDLLIKEKKYGLLTYNGEEIIAPFLKKKHIQPLKNGARIYSTRAMNGRLSYIDYQYGKLFNSFSGNVFEADKLVIKIENETPTYYNNGVELNTNKIFKYITLFENETYLISKKRKKIKITDKKNETSIKIKNLVPIDFNKYGITYFKNKTQGIISYHNDTIVKDENYLSYTELNENLLITTSLEKKIIKRRKGIITKKGRLIFPCKFEKIEKVFDGIYLCYNKFGTSLFINSEGDTLKTIHCKSFESTSEGLLLCKFNNYVQFLDSTLSPVFRYDFYDAHPFVKGIATVRTRRGWQVLNRNGNLLSVASYQEIKPIANNTIQAKEFPKKGIYNYKGELIVPVEFERINFVSKTIMQVIKDGKAGYIDIEGKWIYNPF